MNLKSMTWEDLAKKIVNMGDLIRDQSALIEKQVKMIGENERVLKDQGQIIKELRGNNRLLIDMLKAKESE